MYSWFGVAVWHQECPTLADGLLLLLQKVLTVKG